MQRRTMLRRAAIGVGLFVVAAGGGLALWPGDRSIQPRRPLRSISARGFPVLVALAARVLVGTSADPRVIAERVDDSLLRTHPEARRDLDRALSLLENALAGLLLRGQPSPFTDLSIEAQDAALLAWRDSPVPDLRGAYHALRKLCLAAHYATDAAYAETGYGGPSIPKIEPPPITATGALAVVEAAIELPAGDAAREARP